MRKILFCDVDGSLTDGNLFYSNTGSVFYKYSIKDGLAFSELLKIGFEIYVLTGRKNQSLQYRFRNIKITKIFTSVLDKAKIVKGIIGSSTKLITFYFGDDVNDLESMKLCMFIGCPIDANPSVIKYSHFVSSFKGGDGALRDFYDNYLINKLLDFS